MLTRLWLSLMSWLFWTLRPWVKGFLRITTRLCELQRICYGNQVGATRTCQVETSLSLTRSAEVCSAMGSLDACLKSDCDDGAARAAVDNVVAVVMNVKGIKKELHKQFVVSMRGCLVQMCGYKRLLRAVEALRATAYDADNAQHEADLMRLWTALQPGVTLEARRTKQWQAIGFQGDDPKTDFRGMGMLGLENLLYFACEYNSSARHILSHSHHPKYGYSFAIVGINLTAMAYRLLSDGTARAHMYNAAVSSPASAAGGVADTPTLVHFHGLYAYLFTEFDRVWLEEQPRDMMEFTRIRDLFENRVRTLMADTAVCLRAKLVVDNV